MNEIEMYKPKYEAIDIFKALKKSKIDELLPEGGVLDFFYQYARYPGVSLFLRYKSKIKFFYIDHDDFIIEAKDQTPEWNISVDKNIVRIGLLYKVHNTSASIYFVFDISDKSYRDLLIVVRKKKEIRLYYMTMLYGGLVLDSIKKFKVPSHIVNALKQIK